MLSKSGLILLASVWLAVASPTVKNLDTRQTVSHTSDPRNIAYAKKLEQVIAEGVTGNTTDSSELEKREPYCVLLDGNGNPHQNTRHTQISRTGTCGSGDCTISLTSGKSETYAWTWGLNPPGYWINGGFSVSSSETESEEFTCTGKAGETICIWSEIETTAYTVTNHEEGHFSTCGPVVDTSIIWSPNECFNTPKYYCVVGTCRNKNDLYYDTADAPAGGPPTC